MQRVPVTEKQGRRHTSTVRAVWIDDTPGVSPAAAWSVGDIRVDTFRASGPGGQHRNKTSSGVRITHLPTGVVVTATEDRSQHHNRRVAEQRLTDRLASAAYMAQKTRADQTRATDLDTHRDWLWVAWRDQVTAPDGRRASMRRALSGRLDPLLR